MVSLIPDVKAEDWSNLSENIIFQMKINY
jgi:hypothetical protein